MAFEHGHVSCDFGESRFNRMELMEVILEGIKDLWVEKKERL